MKKKLVAIATVSLLLTGCGLGKGLFLRKEIVQEHVTTVPAVTNQVAAVSLEGVTSIVQVVRAERSLTNLMTNVVFEPNPAVLSTIRTVSEVNSAVNPLPFAGAISGLLGLSTIVLGYVAKVKSDKAKLLPAVIQGVELARSPEVKASIKQIASGLGLEKQLHREVKDITG